MFRNIILSAALMTSLLAYPTAAENLVKFDRSKISQAKESCAIKILAKLDNVAVGISGDYYLDCLKTIDSNAAIIRRNVDIARLWITEKKYSIGIAPILETENYLLLDLSSSESNSLIKSGIFLTKCFNIDLPADPPVMPDQHFTFDSALLIDIDSLMNLVSVDSITSYIQRLQDFQTRYSCTDSFWASGDWIYQKFLSWGYDSVYFQEFEITDWCTSRNVIATKVGSTHPDRTIIVGGHFDSVVYGNGDPDTLAPGADDNATGTALAMELARVLANTNLKKTVKFMAFGGEEQGLWGSANYAYYAFYNGEHIELMINADMIGTVLDSYLDYYVKCNASGVPYGQILGDLSSQYTSLIPVYETGDFYGSDHYYFGQLGYRTLWSEEYDFSLHYHQPTDLLQYLDTDYASDIIRSNIGLLYIAQSIPSPAAGLDVQNAGDGHTAYLSWEIQTDPDVAGYEIYLGRTLENMSIVDSALFSADTIDALLEDSLYYFAVACYTADGNRSPIEEFPTLVPQSTPGGPDTLYVLPQIGQIFLQWPANSDFDFDHYNLYRRVGPIGDFQFYQQVFDYSDFTDTGLEDNVRYYYYVTAVDTTDIESQASPIDYAKVFSLNSGILLVDETRDGNGGQGQPTDAQQDSFFNFISQGYSVTHYDIDAEGLLRVNDLGPYSTLVWMDEDSSIKYFADIDEDLSLYLDNGGQLLFVGWRSLYAYGNGRPLVFEDTSFMWRYYSVTSAYSTNNRDFTGATGLAGWPNLNVLPERVLPAFNGKLPGVDVFELDGNQTILYTFNSESGDTLLQDKPAGIMFQNPAYQAIHLTFPLYTMGDTLARDIFRRAMEIFGEEASAIDDGRDNIVLPKALAIYNHPNPFNPGTTIEFDLPENSIISIDIYNILGQKIESLRHGLLSAGHHSIKYDASGLPSGIYFARIKTQDGTTALRKMTLLR